MRCLYNGEHPCGKCPACLANRQRAFCFRLDQEKDQCAFYFWLTLQYDDVHVPRFEDGEMCFSKQHCRDFFEKIRKKYDHKIKKERHFKFKHFLVSEYGPNSTHRPHYHCLFMVYSDLPLDQLYTVKNDMKEFILNEAWPHGHVTEKSFHGRVLSYLTKYCCKPELTGEKHTMKPFTLISRGIGLCYLDTLSDDQLNQMRDSLDFTVRYKNSKIQLPRYYVDKILPHSSADLRALIPLDHENEESWDSYKRMQEIRRRIQQRQNDLTHRRAKLFFKHEQTVDYILDDSKSFTRNIDQEFSMFRAKLRKRKEL